MNYCTLFNSYYLSRGLALYNSLLEHARDFHLYIFAFDEKTRQILTQMQLEHVTVIALSEFETPALLKVKAERNVAEYCWTCTPVVTLHCLEKFNLSDICYLDADLYFWQDPSILLQEAKEASILLTDHHYTPQYDHAAVSGKYCVQFMYFKNDTFGRKALTWWREACLAWCYDRVEDGKFGDQKYLDDWLERFQKVHVLNHLGGGVAPWNVQQYEISKGLDQQKKVLIERDTQEQFDLIFYHFHALKFINHHVDLGTYKLSNEVKESIYRPYISQLLVIEQALKQRESLNALLKNTNLHGKVEKKISFFNRLKNLKKRWRGIYNIHNIKDFKKYG